METPESYSLRDILRILFSHKSFFVVFPVVLTMSAYFGYELKTPVYTAGVRMFIKAQKKTEAEFYRGINTRDIVTDHANLVTSKPVLKRVVDALKLYERPVNYEMKYASPLKRALIKYGLTSETKIPDKSKRYIAAIDRLQSSISVEPIGMSSLFYINVSDFDPRQATLIANSVSRSYVIFDLEQQIEELKLKYGEKHSEVLQLKGYIKQFEKTLDGTLIPDLEAIGPASVKIVAQAESAVMNRGLPKFMMMSLSFFTGIFLAIAFAAIFEYYDSTFKTPRALVEHLKLPTFGSVPRRKLGDKKLISEGNPKVTKYIKSFETLSMQMSAVLEDKNIKTLLITDVEGSRETVIVNTNLGIYLARNAGRKVLIVDADFRNATLSKFLNVPHDVGFANVLEGKSTFMDTVQDLGSNLNILPSGKTELKPSILYGSFGMSKAINVFKDGYDFIFFYSPDLRNYPETVILSSILDGTVFVINEGKVRIQVLDNALAPLIQKKVNILGTILSNRKHVIPEIVYRLT